MNWPISWQNVKDHIDDIEDGINPELLPPGGFGYSKPGKVYTFDGDTTGKLVVENLVKISDDAPDLKKTTKIVGMTNDGMVAEILLDSLVFNEYNGGVQELTDANSPALIAVSSPAGDDETPTGLYVLNEPDVYISRIEFAETIVPIDQKYLPGVCLPVLEMSEEWLAALMGSEDVLGSGGTGLSYSEGPLFEQLENAYNNVTPCVLRVSVENDRIAVIMPLEPNELGSAYSAKFAYFDFHAVRIARSNGLVWECKITEAV